MLARLCQLKSRAFFILLLMILGGCSWRTEPRGTDLMTTFPNRWFSANSSHSLVSSMNEPVPHLMFDTNPEFKSSERAVNVVLATPQGSPHAYDIDLSSGQRFYSHSYCKQKDIWNNYGGSINHPGFSIGYVPRVLDQLGKPQKIIVWSKRSGFLNIALTNYHKVRMVGAYVEQICPDGNCLGKNNWLSRMVFVGVDGEDKSLTGISTIADFKKAFDWQSSKAQLENIDGHNFIGDQTYPATRVGELIEFEDAFDYFKKRAIFLTDKELKKIQTGCHALYDRMWEDIGRERAEDKAAKDVKELNAKLKLREKLREDRKPVGFAARFHKFTKKYYNEVSTCDKFVYHGNINKDPEEFWFLSFTTLFYRLHREGYYFDCRQRSWQRNILNSQGKPVHDIQTEIYDCLEGEIDQAMDYLPNFLASLKGQNEYYRFVDYDNHPFGTHNKLYSWTTMSSKKLECSNNPNTEIKKEMNVFPEDVRWKARNVKDIADNMKIIY